MSASRAVPKTNILAGSGWKRKRAFRDETRLDVSRGDTGRGDTCFPAPWWVEMEFDPKRVERVEKEMLRVLVRGAERSGAFLGE